MTETRFSPSIVLVAQARSLRSCRRAAVSQPQHGYTAWYVRAIPGSDRARSQTSPPPSTTTKAPPTTNPDFDHLLRGTVHDPTTRRMGGVAGQAGVFSTAHDICLYAQALLDKLLHNAGPFPLKQSTLQLMTTPAAARNRRNPAQPSSRPTASPPTGVAQRGFGWDINSAYSRPRGSIFSYRLLRGTVSTALPSFGHTGFTGTSLWIDPASDTYVILLANSVHPRGAHPSPPCAARWQQPPPRR